MEKRLGSPEDMKAEAKALLSRLVPKTAGATLATLSGELGAGKTTFTQGIAETLGVTEPVTSPTFVLEKIYALPPGQPFERLVHIDAYRLEGGTSLTPLGFGDLMTSPNTLVVLEWPERVEDGLPSPDVRITLRVVEDGRTITYG